MAPPAPKPKSKRKAKSATKGAKKRVKQTAEERKTKRREYYEKNRKKINEKRRSKYTKGDETKLSARREAFRSGKACAAKDQHHKREWSGKGTNAGIRCKYLDANTTTEEEKARCKPYKNKKEHVHCKFSEKHAAFRRTLWKRSPSKSRNWSDRLESYKAQLKRYGKIANNTTLSRKIRYQAEIMRIKMEFKVDVLTKIKEMSLNPNVSADEEIAQKTGVKNMPKYNKFAKKEFDELPYAELNAALKKGFMKLWTTEKLRRKQVRDEVRAAKPAREGTKRKKTKKSAARRGARSAAAAVEFALPEPPARMTRSAASGVTLRRTTRSTAGKRKT